MQQDVTHIRSGNVIYTAEGAVRQVFPSKNAAKRESRLKQAARQWVVRVKK